jgi:hypothetical protein
MQVNYNTNLNISKTIQCRLIPLNYENHPELPIFIKTDSVKDPETIIQQFNEPNYRILHSIQNSIQTIQNNSRSRV